MTYTYVFHVDWDFKPTKGWIKTWNKTIPAMLTALRIKVERIIMKQKGRGYHIWVHSTTSRKLTEDQVNMVQWLLNDDVTRVRINRLRTRRGMKRFWSKIFSHVVWRKPLPKNCQTCHLRQVLAEMETEIP